MHRRAVAWKVVAVAFAALALASSALSGCSDREAKLCTRAIAIGRFASHEQCQAKLRAMPDTQKKCAIECDAFGSDDSYGSCLNDCGIRQGDK